MRELPPVYYKDEISDVYRGIFHRELDWQNPKTYNEIICREKLTANDSIKTRLADKYVVRDWIKSKIGEKYLTKLYGVWDNPRDIDWAALPDRFVLKANHGNCYNMVVKDKNNLDIEIATKKLSEWLKTNYYYAGLEAQYRDIPPKILCEEYLDGVADSVYEHQFFCFHGKPEYIWCIKGSHKPDCKASFYNLDWEMQPFSYGYPKDEDIAPRPEHLEEMLEISRILSAPFDHIRVDLYDLPDGRIIFGELTFSTWAGQQKFVPDKYDEIWGQLI